jgi:hypothetical protein
MNMKQGTDLVGDWSGPSHSKSELTLIELALTNSSQARFYFGGMSWLMTLQPSQKNSLYRQRQADHNETG